MPLPVFEDNTVKSYSGSQFGSINIAGVQSFVPLD